MNRLKKIPFVFLKMLIIFQIFSFFSCSSVKIASNDYVKETITNEHFQETTITNSCTITINYPKVTGLKNKTLQTKINDQLKNDFLSDTNYLCLEDQYEGVWTNVERNFKSYVLSNRLLSIISTEITSSNIVAGHVVKTYNIDLESGKFLTNKELINPLNKRKLECLFLEEFKAKYQTDYVTVIENGIIQNNTLESVFDSFEMAISKESIVVFFIGLSKIEGTFIVEIPVKKTKKYIKY